MASSSTTSRSRILGSAVAVVVASATLTVAVVPAPNGTAAGRATPLDAHDVAARRALRVMPRMQRISQLITTRVPGTAVAARDARVLRAAGFGGVIIFGENYRSRTQLARFTRALQVASLGGVASRPRLLVSIDQEGGVVKRMPDVAPFRSHPQLGALARTGSTKAQAAATARALRAVGIHLDLAPVADLDLEPRRVMAARSFGRDPRRVADHVEAFVRGLQAGGGAASVKHFPGFGGANVNSDDALAVIPRSATQLRAADLVPFQRAIAAGADSVMVSHARYAALDRRRPASASPAIYRMLREELGYDGVAVTDSLHAAGFAAAARTNVAQGCVRTIAAGADIALLTGPLADAVACRTALVAAARSSAVLRARIDESAVRVLRLKSRLGLLPTTA